MTITILPPRRLADRGRAARAGAAPSAGPPLYDIMSEMMARRPDPPTLFAALLEARRRMAAAHRMVEDPAQPAAELRSR